MNTQNNNQDACRRAFEDDCALNYVYASRHHKYPDQYQLYETQLRWMGFQAAWNNRPKPPADSEGVELLRDMRCNVTWTDVATMPIPLYERIKDAIAALSNGSAPEAKIPSGECGACNGTTIIDTSGFGDYGACEDCAQPNGSATGEGVEKCPDCGADMIEVCSGLEKISRPDAGGGCIF